jgi:hypothetical protein
MAASGSTHLSTPPTVCPELAGKSYGAVKALLAAGGPVCGCVAARLKTKESEEYMLVPEMMGEHGFADCRWALGLRRGRIKVQSVRREFFDSAQLKTITAGRGNTL